jgi:hypothetical protein
VTVPAVQNIVTMSAVSAESIPLSTLDKEASPHRDTIDDVENDSPQQEQQQQQQQHRQQIAADDTNNGSEQAPAADPPKGPPGPPFSVPDGGLQAWLQVAGGFMLFFNTWYDLSSTGRELVRDANVTQGKSEHLRKYAAINHLLPAPD